MMDLRRMSNWNALSVEAAMQQLNCQDEDTENLLPRCDTVRICFSFFFFFKYLYLYLFSHMAYVYMWIFWWSNKRVGERPISHRLSMRLCSFWLHAYHVFLF